MYLESEVGADYQRGDEVLALHVALAEQAVATQETHFGLGKYLEPRGHAVAELCAKLCTKERLALVQLLVARLS